MRLISIFLFIVLGAGSNAFAAGPVGDLSAWQGRYQVTTCIQCPDHKVDGGANMKNFANFYFHSGKIDPQDQMSCASTDTWVGMDFEVTSDDNTIQDTVGLTTGQCDWGYFETLTATADTLSYSNTRPEDSMSITLTRIDADTYEFHQVRHDDSPSWGYPSDYEYIVRMKKADSTR